MNKNLLVAFDGPNGSGKTTLINLLQQELQEQGFDVIITSPFKNSPFSVLLDTDYLQTFKKEARACLFAADRYWRVDNIIEPNLNEGSIVICDRFVASSYVYQAIDGCHDDFIDVINNKLKKPDIYFFVSASINSLYKRVHKQNTFAKFERYYDVEQEIELFEKARQKMIYFGINTYVIDNDTPVEYALCQILSYISIRLGQAEQFTESNLSPDILNDKHF